MHNRNVTLIVLTFLLTVISPHHTWSASLAAGDWPTWRADAARSAATPKEIDTDLYHIWTRQLGHPLPAWPESQHKIRFDASYEPVVADNRLFVGSMVADHITAYDTSTGKELWRFYTDAPVRFAPLVWQDLVIAVSDDGCAYALETATGKLRWFRRGAPKNRWLIGNFRLISMWPLRGAPVLVEDDNGTNTIYMAAGIWPFMGTFILALDPATGEERWSNSGSGSVYVTQQHNSPAFAGVAPQGYMAAAGDTLLVSGGRTVPASYSRRSGRMRYFEVSLRNFGKDAGGYDVSIMGDRYMNHGCYYDLRKGTPLYNLNDGKLLPQGVVTRIGDHIVSISATSIALYNAMPETVKTSVVDRKGVEKTVENENLVCIKHLTATLTARQAHFAAGQRLYLSGLNGWIGALDTTRQEKTGYDWEAKVDGNVWTMIPGDGKLFVVTTDGAIHAFGKSSPKTKPTIYKTKPHPVTDTESIAGPEGYAYVWGLADKSISHLTDLTLRYHVIGIDPTPELVATLRRYFDDAGIYGRRIHLLAADPATLSLPPYMASYMEISAGSSPTNDLVRQAWHVLRPYSGVAVFTTTPPVVAPTVTPGLFNRIGQKLSRSKSDTKPKPSPLPDSFITAARALQSEGAKISVADNNTELRLGRMGALPGSAPWSHENADVGNSVVSKDNLVKPPLGLLWFGGPANDDILPRHGHGPTPQVIGGRLYIEGPNALRAVDVYTGRLLWQRAFPGLGKFYDNTAHQPGANEIGSNYASADDSIYVVYNRSCLRLDPLTGDTLSTFTLPGQAKNRAPNWGYIGIYKDLLIAGSEPLAITMTKESKVPSVVKDAPYSSSSKHLVVMNRYSGKILWQREAQQVFRHNAIAAANNMIYCIDGLSAASLSLMRRRGEEPDSPSLLLALDAHTGKLCWSHEDKIFGTWLGYSEEFNILIESGSPARDRARDEAEGQMAAYNATTGEIIWHENFKYNGRPMLRGDTIYTEGTAFSLVAGKPKKRLNPVTGRATTWAYKRNYGCNTPIGGQHMLLFRSAAAGFYDLSTDGGTGNWGGFKSGCTANLIPADGILSAPDYTRTCTCSYQNQCSLGLIPMNDVELWTFQEFKKITGPIQNIAINFGAPGDWPAPDGNLWFEYPVVGGDGPDLGLTTTGKPQYFRRHSLELQGTHQQVAASGIIGETTITIPLGSKVDRIYDVQLIFADPVADKPGQRLFDVTLQNKVVLPKLDVVAASGGHKKSLIHDFTRVIAGEKITIELKQAEGSSLPPLLCGIAISRRDPVHFDFILNTDAASSPRADALGGQISVSNCYPQPLQGNFTVTLADNVVISRELNLDNLTETTINIDVPANYINTSEQLAVTYDIGPDFGKFRHLSDSFALSAPIPLDIRFTAASVDTINIEARGIDPNLTQHPELTLLLNNEEIHKTTLEIPPMTSTSIPCQLPLKLYDTKATLTAKVKWPATETPLSGEFSDTFSFVTLPTRPVGAPPSAKPSITLDRKSGVFPEGVRKKVADTDDNTATIDWWSDGEALEIRAWVTDDHHFNTKEKDGIWNGDALQMCFAAFDGSYVNIALALTTKGKVLWCYDGDAEKIYQHAVTSVVRNDAIMETAYSLRIPLDILGIDSKPGSILRANFVVFDDDNGNGFKYWRQLTPGLAGGFNLNEYHIFAIGEP